MLMAKAITSPMIANDETSTLPSANFGRSSLTHVMVSPGLSEGVGIGVGTGVAVEVGAPAEGVEDAWMGP